MHHLYTYYECAPAHVYDCAPSWDPSIPSWLIGFGLGLLLGLVICALRPPPVTVNIFVTVIQINAIFNQLRANALTFNRPDYIAVLNEAEAKVIDFLRSKGVLK